MNKEPIANLDVGVTSFIDWFLLGFCEQKLAEQEVRIGNGVIFEVNMLKVALGEAKNEPVEG